MYTESSRNPPCPSTRPVTRGCTEKKPSPAKFSPPPSWKNVLDGHSLKLQDIVLKIWALLTKLFAALVSQVGYGPAINPIIYESFPTRTSRVKVPQYILEEFCKVNRAM